MPRKPKPPALIGGPYTMPPCERFASLKCEIRDRVQVEGITDAPIPWPWCYLDHGGGRGQLVLTGDLVEAVKTESAQAVAYHWGVSRWTVARWRKALGVGRMTPGTKSRWAQLARGKLAKARAARVNRPE